MPCAPDCWRATAPRACRERRIPSPNPPSRVYRKRETAHSPGGAKPCGRQQLFSLATVLCRSRRRTADQAWSHGASGCRRIAGSRADGCLAERRDATSSDGLRQQIAITQPGYRPGSCFAVIDHPCAHSLIAARVSHWLILVDSQIGGRFRGTRSPQGAERALRCFRPRQAHSAARPGAVIFSRRCPARDHAGRCNARHMATSNVHAIIEKHKKISRLEFKEVRAEGTV